MTRAIVERHTFAIDAYARNTGDVSTHDGHVYSNKSPGLSIIGVVPSTVSAGSSMMRSRIRSAA